MQHVLATHLKLHALGPGLLSPLGSLGRMRSPLGCATGGCWWLKPLEAGRSWLVDRGYPLMDCDNPTHNPIISVESSTKHHLSVISTYIYISLSPHSLMLKSLWNLMSYIIISQAAFVSYIHLDLYWLISQCFFMCFHPSGKKSNGTTVPNIWKNKIHVPNHQTDINVGTLW